uniref:Putative secreted peptide n=1 Tax=Anopheles braziliensis TaxID=58242 RepID=A0A2M3ZWP8_9DIPT
MRGFFRVSVCPFFGLFSLINSLPLAAILFEVERFALAADEFAKHKNHCSFSGYTAGQQIVLTKTSCFPTEEISSGVRVFREFRQMRDEIPA